MRITIALSLLLFANAAKGTTLDFDSVIISGCIDGTSYMANFGISVTGSASARICTSAPAGGAQAFSGANLLLLDNPPPTNSTYTFSFVFNNPVDNVSFVRTAINPDSTGPAWTASALSITNLVLASTGEGTTFAPSAQLFSLNAVGIASVRFFSDNTSARTYNTPPIDNLSFTSTVPEPSTFGLAILCLAGISFRKKVFAPKD